MSIKRLVFSTGKALLKNTTRMGGDFSANLKGPALRARKEHGVTFAPEIGQQHTGSLIKSKREAVESLLDKKCYQKKHGSSR